MVSKNTLIRTTLALIILVAAWMTLSYRPKQAPMVKHDIPDAFMEGVNAIIMDEEGNPKLRIKTPNMVYFGKNDTSHLTKPTVTIYRQSPQPWFISSKQAKATHGIDDVDFWEDVVITHAADKWSPMTTIKTPKLTVHPQSQTAETAEPITMTQPNIVVTAIGMQADMKAGSIKLLSEATGEYVPNS